jgi:hypothetical protein
MLGSNNFIRTEGATLRSGVFLHNNYRAYSAGAPFGVAVQPNETLGSVSTYAGQDVLTNSFLMPDQGATNGYRTGLGMNAFWDGANWRTVGTGANNGGALITSEAGGGWPFGGAIDFFTIPNTAATAQTITEANLDNYRRFVIDKVGHLHSRGVAPGISVCGTGSPSVVGNDVTGKITTGGGALTSCLLTFANAWANAPSCFVNDETTATLIANTTTTGTMTVKGAVLTGITVSYHCFGR